MTSRNLRISSAIPAFLLLSNTLSAEVAPHDVPAEFEATQYVVAVNNVPVKVFHAGLNVYFASFDFTGAADVRVTVPPPRGTSRRSDPIPGSTITYGSRRRPTISGSPTPPGVRLVGSSRRY